MKIIDKKAEKDIRELSFEEVKKILNQKTNGYIKPYIQRQLKENINLRKVFLALIKENPAKISEIEENSLLTKPTCYTQLYKLLEFRLINQIFIIDIYNGKIKNDEVKKKFEDWTKTMREKLKRYYMAKTSYWEVSKLGKELAGIAFYFDQEFKEKNKVEENKSGNI